MNSDYRILIKESREIKGGTCIPMSIPACFREDKSNFFIGEIHNFKNLLFGKRLNNYGACRFDILVDDVEANSLISLCEYEVYIYKVTSSGDVLVWSGEQRRRTGSLVENHDDWCTIYCYDWLYALKDRYTAQSMQFNQIDAGLIAWYMILISQGYDSDVLESDDIFPSEVSEDTSIGTLSWDNPTYIETDDSNYSQIDFGSSENISYYLKATNFGFSIPDNTEIIGIEVITKLFNDKGKPSHYLKDSTIKLIKNGVIQGNNLGNNEDQDTHEVEVNYGGNNNLWGSSWTSDDINSSNFGVALSYTGDGSIINLNCVKIVIYFKYIGTNTNADLGITKGIIAITQNRDRTYENQNIMEAIINLSDVINGFDFEITDDKVFNVYTIKGTDLTDSLILEYGRNLQTVSIDEDFTEPCNNAIVLGEVIDGEELTRVDRPDTTTQAKYKLREMVLSADNVIDENTLAEKGDAMLYKYKEPLIKVTFEVMRGKVDITQFSLGDLIRLIIKKGCYNIDSTYRIFEWTINHENDNTEKLSLILGELGI